LGAKPKKFRYKARKRQELLEQAPESQMRWLEGPDGCADLLDAMRVIEENSLKKEAVVSIFERE